MTAAGASTSASSVGTVPVVRQAPRPIRTPPRPAWPSWPSSAPDISTTGRVPTMDHVSRGIAWLVHHQKKTGEIFLGGTGNSQMYSHAIATMALCEAYGISKDHRLEMPAQLAIDFIVQAQNKDDGGWRYSPGMRGDTSVFGWQMFALRSAAMSGLNVSKNVIKGCHRYLDQAAADKDLTTYRYEGNSSPTHVMSAEALLCRQYLGWSRDHPPLVKGVSRVWDNLQTSKERNIYYWYYATQLLHNMQNEAWKQWNPKIRDSLIATQVVSKGCDHGSWSPTRTPSRPLGSRGRPAFPDLDVDPDPRSLLSLPAALPEQRSPDRHEMTWPGRPWMPRGGRSRQTVVDTSPVTVFRSICLMGGRGRCNPPAKAGRATSARISGRRDGVHSKWGLARRHIIPFQFYCVVALAHQGFCWRAVPTLRIHRGRIRTPRGMSDLVGDVPSPVPTSGRAQCSTMDDGDLENRSHQFSCRHPVARMSARSMRV